MPPGYPSLRIYTFPKLSGMLTFLLAKHTVLVVFCICYLLEADLYSLSVSQIEMIAREHRASGQIIKKLHDDI